MDRLDRLEQVVKNLNETVKELQAEVKALKGEPLFIELVYGDTTEFLAIDAIALVEKTPEGDFPYAVVLKTGHIKQLSQRLYDQIYAVLHKPTKLSPPVGEPLREIVGEAWESKEGDCFISSMLLKQFTQKSIKEVE